MCSADIGDDNFEMQLWEDGASGDTLDGLVLTRAAPHFIRAADCLSQVTGFFFHRAQAYDRHAW